MGDKARTSGKRLRIFPHAFEGANAYYDPEKVALLFGYFRADEDDPGPNLPGQTVFSCLSHDIIAHETAYALVDRLRERFTDPTNRDVAAFHEGFSDIVAIFQHFSFREVLGGTIQKTRADLRSPSSLVALAAQFGYATGSGRALRDALDSETGGKPDPTQMATLVEPQASKTAQNILTMCIRAFEYLPPVDVTFGDFLRAVVTADWEMVPEDDVGLRAAMIESCRVRGIYPEGASSLAEDSLLWRPPEKALQLPFEPFEQRLAENARAFDRWGKTVANDKSATAMKRWAVKLVQWAGANATTLGLDPDFDVGLLGFHTVFRVAPSGELMVELVAQFEQNDKATQDDPAYGGVPFRGGTTVIAGADGSVRYVVTKLMSAERRARQKAYVEELDRTDAALAWCDDRYEARRMRLRTSFAALHRGLR